MKNLKSSFFLFSSAFLLFILSSCEYNNQGIADVTPSSTSICDTISKKFSNDIKPIIIAKCAVSGCHEANGQSPAFDATADIYANLTPYLSTNEFKDRVINRTATSPMPPDPLTNNELQKIKCWFEGGYPNN